MSTVTVTSGADCDVEVAVDLDAALPAVTVDLPSTAIVVDVELCPPEA